MFTPHNRPYPPFLQQLQPHEAKAPSFIFKPLCGWTKSKVSPLREPFRSGGNGNVVVEK